MIWRSTTLRFAALVFVLQIVTAATLLALVGTLIRQQSSARSIAIAETLRDGLVGAYREGGATVLRDEIGRQTTQTITRGAVMLLVDRSGNPVAGNLSGWPPSLALGKDYTEDRLYLKAHVLPETMLLRGTTLSNGDRLLTGIVVEDDHRLLAFLEQTSVLALALGLIFATFAAWLSAKLITARLETTIGTLRAVREGKFDQRAVVDPSGDAFATLGEEVNRTLDRISGLIDELKMATDGLAHDLKSPLTRMRVLLEGAAQTLSNQASGDLIDRALQEGERLMTLVETALSISRAEAGMGRESFSEVDLAEILVTTAEIYEPLVEQHDRRILVSAPEHFKRVVHQQLLQQALGNLVDNALKYGSGAITLSLAVTDAGLAIRVADEGIGIASDKREEALRRFNRLDTARQGTGAGLGLSLVQAVAHLHEGHVILSDGNPGLVVTMMLPPEGGV